MLLLRVDPLVVSPQKMIVINEVADNVAGSIASKFQTASRCTTTTPKKPMQTVRPTGMGQNNGGIESEVD
jgi:hypothetical protein